jgi:hypothetical protein
MEYSKFIQPKTVKFGDRTYTISRIPAVEAIPICNAVAEAIAQNGIMGVIMLPVAMDRKILSYTASLSGTVNIVPDTDQLLNDIFTQDVGDIKRLVAAMVKENFGFLTSGDLLRELAEQTEATGSGS